MGSLGRMIILAAAVCAAFSVAAFAASKRYWPGPVLAVEGKSQALCESGPQSHLRRHHRWQRVHRLLDDEGQRAAPPGRILHRRRPAPGRRPGGLPRAHAQDRGRHREAHAEVGGQAARALRLSRANRLARLVGQPQGPHEGARDDDPRRRRQAPGGQARRRLHRACRPVARLDHRGLAADLEAAWRQMRGPRLRRL